MKTFLRVGTVMAVVFAGAVSVATQSGGSIGREVSVPSHLQDGDEFASPLWWLVAYGEQLFTAVWTNQEGGGRPLTKGTGAPLTVPSNPLVFPRNFNRVSAPDANSCAGCHNAPRGIPGGGGDIVANVFVLGQRFDFATFDGFNTAPTGGAFDENGLPVGLQNIANSRATLGMFGSGYIELLAREITADLQALRDATPPGGSTALRSKGVSYGTIQRWPSGDWVTTGVEGLAAPSLATTGPADPPNLIVRPFHQAGNVVSIRQFTNNAFNHHHGIQSTERFGDYVDPDNDGFVNEITRADITAVTIFQATMAVPGRVIPNDPDVEAAVLVGESRFGQVGCASCHIPSLPLRSQVFTEPNPYNPAGNLRVGDGPTLSVDLTSRELPAPRLTSRGGGVLVPAFTDLKLHDITSGPGDPNREALDMNQPAGSPEFFAGNGKFLTRKLWGVANEPPFFHHGQYTTLRDAILAHNGEALASRVAFDALVPYEQDSIVEFLKTLQVLPAGTKALVVDENGRPKAWPPKGKGSDNGKSKKSKKK
ncbi:MAG: thiol oxidoreductase [Acidobacteria bacterium]|nr:thiol oxidoreductase [Acidobacteriota bacterium]